MPVEQGQLHALPLLVPESLTLGQLFVEATPWGAPALLAMEGVTNDEARRPRTIIAYEWPTPEFPGAAAEYSKEDIERVQLERFVVDVRLGTGRSPFIDFERGGDRHDFLVRQQAGQTARLDVTQLAAGARRGLHALFGRLRSALFAQQRDALSHLAGSMVYFWFTSPELRLSAPPRAGAADGLVDEIIDALKAHRPSQTRLQRPLDAPLPPTAPSLGAERTASGVNLYTVPFSGSEPATPFFMRHGFELGVAVSTSHSPDSAWDELERVVEKHDKGYADELLVTVGAPDRVGGHTFPSDELVGRLLFSETPTRPLSPRNLRRIFLHYWRTGAVVDAFPGQTTLIQPRWSAYTPAHRVLRQGVTMPDQVAPTGPR